MLIRLRRWTSYIQVSVLITNRELEIRNEFVIFTDLQAAYSQAIMGSVVLTSYNNKTYKIDEVDFSATPTSTFTVKKKGETSNVSYMDYYEKVNLMGHQVSPSSCREYR